MVRRARHGFTLVELLIVIGILLLLLGIGTIGYMHIDKVAAERATRTRFDSCSAILNEYETAGVGLNAIDSTSNASAVYYNGSGLPVATNPGDVNVGSGGRGAAAVTMTGSVLQAMSHVPAVKSTLTAIPASALLPNYSPPILVDGWKNPIIYVPTGGLSGVMVTQGTGAPVAKTVTAIDNRPFWASAGQDGNFTNGDDNLYSCAVVYH